MKTDCCLSEKEHYAGGGESPREAFCHSGDDPRQLEQGPFPLFLFPRWGKCSTKKWSFFMTFAIKGWGAQVPFSFFLFLFCSKNIYNHSLTAHSFSFTLCICHIYVVVEVTMNNVH